MKLRRYKIVLGDTYDTTIYRDTEISRYWYRVFLDTFLVSRVAIFSAAMQREFWTVVCKVVHGSR